MGLGMIDLQYEIRVYQTINNKSHNENINVKLLWFLLTHTLLSVANCQFWPISVPSPSQLPMSFMDNPLPIIFLFYISECKFYISKCRPQKSNNPRTCQPICTICDASTSKICGWTKKKIKLHTLQSVDLVDAMNFRSFFDSNENKKICFWKDT